MNNRLIEWATTPRGVIVEMGLATWGKSAGEDPRMGRVPMDAVPSAVERIGCDCGCPGCGVDCGCDCCSRAQLGSSRPCPACGRMLMSDGEGCDECSMKEADHMDEGEHAHEGKSCSECGAMYEGDTCEQCGRSEMLESVILEAKKRKKKKLSMATQKKIAKTAVKKAGKGKDGKVSMTKLAKSTAKWAKEPYAAAQYRKQLAKK